MLETLLESKSKRDRSVTGALGSVVTHTVLIGAALYATARAGVQPAGPPETFRPVYFPSAQHPVSTMRPTASRQQPLVRNTRPVYVDPHIDISIPGIDITDVVSRSGDFSPVPIGAAESSNGGESGAGSADTPFRSDQVEKQVALVPGGATPRYPELLRSSGVEGKVIAEFVVDEQGRADDRTVRFVRSDNALFEDAVRVALRRMRFVPAEVGGRKVKQLVQMPFVFSLAH